jgi:hypothetical protein
MELDHDGYAKDRPIVVADDLSRVQFTVENRTAGAHDTGLTLAGLPDGEFRVTVAGKVVTTVRGSSEPQRITLPIGTPATTDVTIARR